MKTVTNTIHLAFALFAIACFALSPTANANQPHHPNKRMIPINIKKPLQCAGGDVILQGDLVVTFKNVPDLEVVPGSLKLEGFRGTAASGGRKLEVNPKDLDFLPFLNVDTRMGEGKFGIEFKVTGPGLPGGSPLRFRVRLSPIVYKFRDRKVTKIIPDDTPIVRCIN
jgi:hypothetical protein